MHRPFLSLLCAHKLAKRHEKVTIAYRQNIRVFSASPRIRDYDAFEYIDPYNCHISAHKLKKRYNLKNCLSSEFQGLQTLSHRKEFFNCLAFWRALAFCYLDNIVLFFPLSLTTLAPCFALRCEWIVQPMRTM